MRWFFSLHQTKSCWALFSSADVRDQRSCVIFQTAHLTRSFPCIHPLTGFNSSVSPFPLLSPLFFPLSLHVHSFLNSSASSDPTAGPFCLRLFQRCCWQSFSCGNYNHGLYSLPPAPKVDCIWLPSLCYFVLKMPCYHMSVFLLDHDFLVPWAEMAPHQKVYSYLMMLDLTQNCFSDFGDQLVGLEMG